MSGNSEKKVVTRFAPSPTGFMHVGNLRTGFYAWLLARKHGGTFILRIEDTDKKREVEGSVDHIKRALKWIGMDWDEGPDVGGPHAPYIQSERLDLYKSYAQKLIEKGLAYADPYTTEEIEAWKKQAEAEKKAFLYREHRPENPPVWDGTQPLRFKVTNLKRYTWTDAVWGELSAGEEALDDLILIKSDGFPTYNFAHIVDDIEMGVTHVMRGQEFIASTPKYLSIYEAFEIEPPIFATTPPVMGDEGKKKLGKRDGAKDVLEYEKEGYLPETMMNFLALLGWNPGGEQEIFTKEELIKLFSLDRIQRSGGQFGEDKLDWMNKEHIKKLPMEIVREEIANRLKKNPTIGENDKLNDVDFLAKVSDVVMDHISKWSDIDTMIGAGEIEYFFEMPQYGASQLYWKGNVDAENTIKHLKWVSATLESAKDASFASTDAVKALIFDYATLNGRGEVLWPLRVALSGKDKSPDPFTLVYILGRNESIKRITDAIGKIS